VNVRNVRAINSFVERKDYRE